MLLILICTCQQFIHTSQTQINNLYIKAIADVIYILNNGSTYRPNTKIHDKNSHLDLYDCLHTATDYRTAQRQTFSETGACRMQGNFRQSKGVVKDMDCW